MRLSLALAFLAVSLGTGCAEPPPPEPFLVSVKVEGDPGKPVVGATMTRSNKLLGTTKADGRATLKLTGVEGEISDVTVTCPEGFQAPAAPLGIRLTRIAEKSKLTEYAVQCSPSMRRVVVAVRADNGPNLPVVYLDQTVTRTDAAGAASFALEVAPGSQFNVSLDTSERKDIKPISPSKLFVVSTQDDVFLFDQRFEVEKKRLPPAQVVHLPRPL